MLLFLLAYLGGVLTILSPCILPVLPFVFARADRPFLTNGLPLLAGMAITFSLIAGLAAAGGELAITVNSVGRIVAMVMLAFFAMLLIFPSVSDRVMAPFARLGDKLAQRAEGKEGLGSSLLLGVATGLLWAPCAGPILGLILTGAALSGASATTALLLLAYGLGAATSLAIALLAGGKVFNAMKRSMSGGQNVKRFLGVLILVGVAAIATGFDTRVLARISGPQTASFEQGLANALGLDNRDLTTKTAGGMLPDEGPWPGLDGGTRWLNGKAPDLEGKVVLIDFWTYSCINCIRAVPFVQDWHEKYADDGLVIIGVHSPEFAFEKDIGNVEQAIADYGITYPVLVDNDKNVWRAFENRYWPAHYLRDAQGRLRYHHFGEGKYEITESAIRALLAEAGAAGIIADSDGPDLTGNRVQADFANVYSPETYLGWGRTENFVSPQGVTRGTATRFTAPATLERNQWALSGTWTMTREHSRSETPGGAIAMNIRARDVNLVLGSRAGQPIRARVTLDGKPPGKDAGVDVAPDGTVTIDSHRLYQLVRHQNGEQIRQFRIEFFDPGVEAYAFTFG
ncbi:cytochrome c biogenesis protein DipZ [Sphingomicrobium marinum]|uniref:cytochrome c biogenesis protein DipZ n=1 Tax=Sphingomicrobium marinum TaxID=1227950 RepID=UPI00223F2CE4|nr:cytochrome c biogenesis protein DipZ [Sphingomicrobium marinum]